MSIRRRTFLKSAALGALAFTIGGRAVMLTPRQARAENIPFTILSDSEAAILNAYGEIMALGAAEAGIAHYVDAQLAAAADDALFMIRYLDVPPVAWTGFYKGGLAALEVFSQFKFGKSVAALDGDEGSRLVESLHPPIPQIDGWPSDAPNPAFVYIVIRGDAIDVVYGTMEGFAALGVPYMAHIEPETRW